MRIFTAVLVLALVPFVAKAGCEDVPFESQRNICFATANLDASYCEKINDNDTKLYCWAKVKSDKSYCKKMKLKNNQRECMKEIKKDLRKR